MNERKVIPKDIYMRIIQYGCSLLTAIRHNDWPVVEVMTEDLDSFDISHPDSCIIFADRKGREDIARKLARDIPMNAAHVYRCIQELPGSSITDTLQYRFQEELEKMIDSNDNPQQSSSWCSIL